MAVLTKSQFDTLYNSSGSGTFLDNSSQAIVEASMRSFAKDIEDSFFNLTDNKYSGAAGVYLNISDTTGLKAVTTVGVTVGFLIFYRDSSGNLNSYQLVSGTDAESLPTVVRPTDYNGATNQKVWKIASTTSGATISSGTYTPTLTNTTNVSSSTAYQCQYLRVGSVVTVSGMVGITATAGAGTFTVLRMSLPISSNVSAIENLGGTHNQSTGSENQGVVYAATAAHLAEFAYAAVSTSALNRLFIFQYLIN